MEAIMDITNNAILVGQVVNIAPSISSPDQSPLFRFSIKVQKEDGTLPIMVNVISDPLDNITLQVKDIVTVTGWLAKERNDTGSMFLVLKAVKVQLGNTISDYFKPD